MSDVKPPETSHSGSFIEKASTHDSGSIDVVHGELKSLDVGLALVADRSEDADLSPQESKRLRRKIDWHLLPMLFLIYTVQFLDKGTLASSSILGFIADNHLTSSQFNTLSSAFYIVVLRFLLGASEGSMTAGLMLVCSMFYTRTEIGERLGWTFQCNGLAVIISGFLQFGIAHTSPSLKPQQWQWLMLTTALITFIPFLLFLFFFPNNPTNACS
ncbi:hypothetical protein EW026_g6935 [Hermanssonia centrifuga]|uniref:Major facilitator superfamily (MFS) profile domain-containing protein n=1 Tax=Hermanssonia centrifuga TaxID=98765 RepID=A0A4S4K9M1_9APHY|nr:hypothetical protein EW026_g6935 [Hermanssonia centrifuga]